MERQAKEGKVRGKNVQLKNAIAGKRNTWPRNWTISRQTCKKIKRKKGNPREKTTPRAP